MVVSGLTLIGVVASVSAGSPMRALAFVETSYTVKPGDTLFGIAGDFGVAQEQMIAWVSKVASLNALADEDVITPGQKLSLPDASSPLAGGRATASGQTYTVQLGDMLLAIAIKQGIPEAQAEAWMDGVVQLNDLKSRDSIVEAQLLSLPKLAITSSDSTPAPGDAGSGATSAPTATRRTSEYTIVDGDTLYAIADKLGIADDRQRAWVSDVVDLNELSSADALTLGAVLTVPSPPTPPSATALPPSVAAAPPPLPPPPAASVTVLGSTTVVQEGDTLAAIASRQGIADAQVSAWTDAIVALNGLVDEDSIRVGQTLSLPAAGSLPAPQSTTAQLGNTYVVQEEDKNLFDLAGRLNVPASQRDAWVAAVVGINNLDARGLYPGDVLKLPE